MHSGVDTGLDKYQTIQSQLREAIIGKGKNSWDGINSTKRKAFKIDKLLGEQCVAIKDSLSLVFKLFGEIRSLILKHIPYLGKSIQYNGQALLADFDYITGQEPHRDFSQTKTQDDE